MQGAEKAVGRYIEYRNIEYSEERERFRAEF